MNLEHVLRILEVRSLTEISSGSLNHEIGPIIDLLNKWSLLGREKIPDEHWQRILSSKHLCHALISGIKTLVGVGRPFYFRSRIEFPLNLASAGDTTLPRDALNKYLRLGYYPAFIVETLNSDSTPNGNSFRLWHEYENYAVLGEAPFEKKRAERAQDIDDVYSTTLMPAWKNSEHTVFECTVFSEDALDFPSNPRPSLDTSDEFSPPRLEYETTVVPDIMPNVRIKNKNSRKSDNTKGISTHRSQLVLRWLSEERPAKDSSLSLVFELDSIHLEDDTTRKIMTTLSKSESGTIELSSLGHFLLTKQEILAPAETWNTVFRFCVADTIDQFIPINARTTREDFAETLHVNKRALRNDGLPARIDANAVRSGSYDHCLFIPVTEGSEYALRPTGEDLKKQWVLVEYERALLLGDTRRPPRKGELNEKTWNAVTEAKRSKVGLHGFGGVHGKVFDDIYRPDCEDDDLLQNEDGQFKMEKRALAAQRQRLSREKKKRSVTSTWKNPYLKQ